MKIQKHVFLAVTAVAAALSISTDGVRAQTITKSGAKSVTIGTSLLGAYGYGSASFTARRQITTLSASGYTYLSAYGKLLGTSNRLALVSASASTSTSGSHSASFLVDIAGVRMVNSRFTTSNAVQRIASRTWTRNLLPSDMFYGLDVGIGKVGLRANVGVVLSAGTDLSMYEGAYARITGSARAYGYARAKLDATFLGTGATASASGNILDTTISANANADARWRIYVPGANSGMVNGSVSLLFRAVSAKIEGCLTALWLLKKCGSISFSFGQLNFPNLFTL